MKRSQTKQVKEHVRAAMLGAVIGDALGVPYEFSSREEMRAEPAAGMIGYRTHQQPAGTWSDDSSLLLCAAESLSETYESGHMAALLLRWFDEGYMTPHGEVFDFGSTTARAMDRLRQGIPAEDAGLDDENSNGNGSLMRILPVGLRAFGLQDRDILTLAAGYSGITHAHPRSRLACGYFSVLAGSILRRVYVDGEPADAHATLRWALSALADLNPSYPRQYGLADEQDHFDRLLSSEFADLPASGILSDGYVVHTLEAAVWCVLTTSSYQDAVLKAVNLGDDTDTTACVAGGLAGLLYGMESLPADWLAAIQNTDLVYGVVDSFAKTVVG